MPFTTVKQNKLWRSEVYKHFWSLAIIHDDDKILYKFTCKKQLNTELSTDIKLTYSPRKPSVSVTHAHHDNSTSKQPHKACL